MFWKRSPRRFVLPGRTNLRGFVLPGAGRLQDSAIAVAERILKTRTDVETAAARARTDAPPAVRASVLQAAAGIQTKLNALEKRFRVTPEMSIGVPREDLVLEKVWIVVDTLQTSMDPPTPSTLAWFETAEKALDAYLVDFNRFYAEDVAAFRKQIAAAGAGAGAGGGGVEAGRGQGLRCPMRVFAI